MIKFWWRSGSRIRIRVATLARRALAEECTVPVLLVNNEILRYLLDHHLIAKKQYGFIKCNQFYEFAGMFSRLDFKFTSSTLYCGGLFQLYRVCRYCIYTTKHCILSAVFG